MNEWARTALSDSSHFEYLSGLWKGKVPPFETAMVIRNTNFRKDGRLDLSAVAVLDVETRLLERKRLRLGDIIIERSGGGPQQPVGRVCFFDTEGPGPYSFSNFTTALRVRHPETFLPRFVHYYLLYLYDDGFTVPLQRATTGIRNLDFTAYLMAEVPQPPKPEQEKITALLWKVQRAIEVEDKLIVTVRELKQSAMRQLFTRGLRGELQKESDVGLVPESWVVRRLDTCCDVVSSSLSYVELAQMADEGGGSTVRAMGVKVSDMNLPENKSSFVRANLARTLSLRLAEHKLVPPRTVVFPKRGAAIATNKKRLTTAWTALDPNLIGVRPHEGLDVDFLFYWFQQFDLRTITEPGPTPQLNKKNLTPLLLPVPSDLQEQANFVQVLQTIDRKLMAHEHKRATLHDLFKTLLHELMTGRIRVADLDIDVSEVTAA